MRTKNFFVASLLVLPLYILNGQDNKTFESVKIGKKEWMTENLNVNTFKNGDSISEARSVDAWIKAGENKKPAWTYYEYKAENGTVYGKMYNWYAVNDPRGLAPNGWHIPSYKEWVELDKSVGGLKTAGIKVKSETGWSNNGNGDNESGFKALPGGFCSSTGLFKMLGEYGFWWSADQESATDAWLYFLYSKDNGSNASSKSKAGGLSVRCIKN